MGGIKCGVGAVRSIQIYDISLGIHPEAETPSTYLYSLVWSSDMLSALPGSFNTLTISANIAAAVSFDDVQLSQSILLYNVVTRQESLVQMTCHVGDILDGHYSSNHAHVPYP